MYVLFNHEMMRMKSHLKSKTHFQEIMGNLANSHHKIFPVQNTVQINAKHVSRLYVRNYG